MPARRDSPIDRREADIRVRRRRRLRTAVDESAVVDNDIHRHRRV